MRLVFTSDHAGYALREDLAAHAKRSGHEVAIVGAPSEDAYDYPDAADEAVRVLLSKEADFGVFVCGTGIGICMRANRYRGIRGAPCCSVESAKLAREHNDANVLCIGARITPTEQALQILDAFLTVPASDAERHQRRVAKLDGNV
jgi:ribose 5-phosphate isomerase B